MLDGETDLLAIDLDAHFQGSYQISVFRERGNSAIHSIVVITAVAIMFS